MIIVTGGAGFIGSALIASLNKRQITDILVVDELGTDQKWKNLRNLSFADYVEKVDFLEMVIENKLDGSIEAVFHLGACSDTTETDTSYLIKNNYEFSKLLAQWTTADNIRFIYASSASMPARVISACSMSECRNLSGRGLKNCFSPTIRPPSDIPIHQPVEPCRQQS